MLLVIGTQYNKLDAKFDSLWNENSYGVGIKFNNILYLHTWCGVFIITVDTLGVVDITIVTIVDSIVDTHSGQHWNQQKQARICSAICWLWLIYPWAHTWFRKRNYWKMFTYYYILCITTFIGRRGTHTFSWFPPILRGNISTPFSHLKQWFS